MEKQKVYKQHEENGQWMNELNFYKDEMKVFGNRISEIAQKYSSKDVLAQIEHFQNQMIVQRDNIDRIAHSIRLGNDMIHAEIRKNGTAVDHRSLADHSDLRNEMESFSKTYNENKKELNKFLSKWM